MKTVIVAIPIEENDNARKDCEKIENQIFENAQNVLDTLKNSQFVGIFGLSYFMDTCNNEEFNLSKYFISYVHLKN